MSKKIAFILGNYDPLPSANGVCVKQLVDYYISKSWDVTVICNDSSYTTDSNIDYESDRNPKIIRVRRPRFFRVKEKFSSKANIYSKFRLLTNGILHKFKQLIMMPLWPLTSVPYTSRMYRKLKKEHLSQKFDVIVPVYTPIDALIAAAILMRKYNNFLFIPYFLDSFSGGFGPKSFSDARIIKVGMRWEKILLSKAAMIVFMVSSEAHHIKYNSNQPFYSKVRYLDIPLLTNKIDTGKITLEEGLIDIVYLGTIHSNVRNPKYLLEILSKIDNQKFKITFIGNHNIPEVFSSYSEVFGSRLKVVNQVSHSIAQKYLYNADILINLGNNNSSLVPSKIFEYMSTGKKILSTTRIDNDPTIRYFRMYDNALIIDESDVINNELVKNVSDFISETKSDFDFEYLSKQLILNTPEAFYMSVQQTMGGHNNE